MAGKSATLMRQMADQVLRFVDGVRKEGGIRRVLFSFPDNPVVVMVVRQAEFEEMGTPESTKANHKYEKQVAVTEQCGWCGLKAEHSVHV